MGNIVKTDTSKHSKQNKNTLITKNEHTATVQVKAMNKTQPTNKKTSNKIHFWTIAARCVQNTPKNIKFK